MPLYICRNTPGAVSTEAKQKIAEDITRIHCEITGAPPIFVHAFFFDQPDGLDAELHGTIRAGRTDEQKARLAAELRTALHARSGLPLEACSATISETPASWVMEGGEIFPEPGEEEAWLAEHGERLGGARRAEAASGA